MILVNVTWTENGIDKESIGLEPRVAGKLMYELERKKGIKARFFAKSI